MSFDESFLNYHEPLTIRSHHLPHFEQDSKLQFVTFRLADALPTERLMELRNIKESFIARYPKPWDNETLVRYNHLGNGQIDKWLDAGHGACLLKDKRLRTEVVSAIEFMDGNKSEILAYVVMPNHVHLLHRPSEGIASSAIIGSIRRYSALQINRITGRRGSLWQKECYDRIIRGYRHLDYVVNYIRNNPLHLPSGTYSLGGRLLAR